MSGAQGSSEARAFDVPASELPAQPWEIGAPGDSARPTLVPSPEHAPRSALAPSDRLEERRENIVVPAIAGVMMLLLAFALMPATPGQGDGAEFTLALALAGLPHPTGYPLYVLLGHPFVSMMHAIGFSWPAAANAWSAVAAAVALALFARLGLELARAISGRDTRLSAPSIRLAALLPAMLLALNPVWLIAATQAEVHSMWYACIAGAALFALIQVRRMHATTRARAAWRDPDVRAALGWGLVCGVSLAHHVTSVLILAPLSVLLGIAAWRTGRLRPVLLAAGVAGFLIPLSAYGFVAYRAFHPVAYQWPADPNWDGVWSHLTASMYTRYLGGFAPVGIQPEIIRVGVMPFLLAVPMVGVWVLTIGSVQVRRWLMTMLIGVAILTTFVFRYGVPDPAAYFVPALMLGYLVAIPLVVWNARRGSTALAACFVLAAIVAAGSWAIPLAMSERVRLARVDARMREGWNAIPFDRGFVLFLDDHCTRLQIFQLLQYQRPDLYAINPNLLTWPAQRNRFARQFGFDPVPLVQKDYFIELPGILRRETGLPVVDFRDVLEGRLPRR